MKIFLIGLPGSGKSTIGKELAQRCGLPFVDLDDEVERQAGRSVREIFAGEGEQRFRELESNQLGQWCSRPAGFVMATGGGAPAYGDNMETIRKAGYSFFLDVPVDVIVERMNAAEISERPLLNSNTGEDIREKLGRLRSQRVKHYLQATITLRGDSISAETILAMLPTS